mmetsp:Transcript_4802/g.15198  ORF Transcript_4802/g.15198 Transcript_4802/m.15198 type:complete len:239 (-) Transcript_4802:1434-2150(-)
MGCVSPDRAPPSIDDWRRPSLEARRALSSCSVWSLDCLGRKATAAAPVAVPDDEPPPCDGASSTTCPPTASASARWNSSLSCFAMASQYAKPSHISCCRYSCRYDRIDVKSSRIDGATKQWPAGSPARSRMSPTTKGSIVLFDTTLCSCKTAWSPTIRGRRKSVSPGAERHSFTRSPTRASEVNPVASAALEFQIETRRSGSSPMTIVCLFSGRASMHTHVASPLGPRPAGMMRTPSG